MCQNAHHYRFYHLQVLRGHISSVRDVAFNPAGTHIASASLDGEVKLWSSTNGSQVSIL